MSPIRQPYLEPGELMRPILATTPPLTAEVVETLEYGQVDQTNVRLLTEKNGDDEVRMFLRICRPRNVEGPLAPVLLIPGGRGRFIDPALPAWIANRTGTLVAAPDWIGAGSSDDIEGISPWANAIYWEGTDVRDTFQFHQLRALLRARDYLLSHEDADPTRLMAMGSSWGGFYSLLLGGLDARFTHLFVTYGCGFLDLEAHSNWKGQFASMPPERCELWLRAFDPARRAHLIAGKVYYQQATNDRFFGLAAAMATWARIRTPKRLLLVPNSDHDLGPFRAQDIDLLKAVVDSPLEDTLPVVEARWVDQTNEVLVTLAPDCQANVTVVYAAGDYTGSFGRSWKIVPALRRHDGSLAAHVPVVDPGRVVRFFAHAQWGEPLRGASSPVETVVPREVGFDRVTASYDPRLDLTSDEFWRLPITNGTTPSLELVEEEGRPRISMQFSGEVPSERGVWYGIEGDAASSAGYDGISLSVRVPNPDDVASLSLVLVTDYQSESEQLYGIPLASLGLDFTGWQHLTLSFAHFEGPAQPRVEGYFHGYEPELKPLVRERLNGAGLLCTARGAKAEALLSDLRLVRIAGTSDEPRVARREKKTTVSGYNLSFETDLDPEGLREKLRAWAPWRHEIAFSNGVRTSDFPIAQPFVSEPLAKWHTLEDHIPREAIEGGSAIDIGSNIGQYSLFLAKEFGMSVLGVEPAERNLEVARFLLELSGLDGVEFQDADASTFRLDRMFDLALVLGTLDHLRHPQLALDNLAAMLRPDGYIAIELQTYVSLDGFTSRYVAADPTTSCEWYLGPNAVVEMLRSAGFDRIEIVHDWENAEAIGADMRRTSFVARRPAQPD